jgi:hypothetical protein
MFHCFTRVTVALFVVLLTTVGRASAANHYVRAGATGNGSGSDWTNACTDFIGSCAVSSLVRGDTYYVAGGVYTGARRITTAESGTLTITIKGATAADHGTATGWSAAFGVDVTQARWPPADKGDGSPYGVLIETSYVTFNGNVPCNNANGLTTCGFRISVPSSCPTNTQGGVGIGRLSSTATTRNVVVQGVAVSACDPLLYDVTANAFQICGNPGYCDNITLANNYSEKTVKFLQASSMANSTIEHNYVRSIGANFSSHAEIMSINNCHSNDGGACDGHTTQCVRGECASNNTVRYNWFGGNLGSSITGGIVALQGHVYGLKDWKIYGNIFIACNGGNGCITVGDSGVVLEKTLIYNNTFVSNLTTGNDLVQNSQYSSDCAQSGGPPIFRNNLVYGTAAGFRQCPGGPNIVHDSNTYLNIIGSPPAGGTNVQTGTSQPFVAYSGTCCSGNYHLANGSTVNGGVSLSSPYNVDRDGTTRGTDGKWDRGAYEYLGAPVVPPAAPTNLHLVP